MAPPILKHNPCIPKASAHRLEGMISAMYAEVAVGLNPVEKPCTRRRIKNPAKELKIGYKKPHNTHAIEPIAMTGTRPHGSVNLPLNGREIPAVRVNKAMIKPLCSPPPNELR